MAQIIYSKYSNERGRGFTIRTDIMEDGAKRYVEKKALYPEGKAHVEQLSHWYEVLSGQYQEIGFNANRCEKTEDGVRLEYLEGRTLEELLDSLILAGHTEEAKERLTGYLEQVQKIYDKEAFQTTEAFEAVFGTEKAPEGMTCAAVTNIDMVCENVVLTEPPTVLDYEWTFDFPVPCQFVLYRIIHYYMDTHSLRAVLDGQEFYRAFGITEELQKYFAGMEKHFQEYITNGHIPMREMFASMTPGVGNKEQAAGEKLQVFFMTDGGYQEENSVSFPIIDNHVFCEIEIPYDCPMVRIDPGDSSCGVLVERLEFDGHGACLREALVPGGVINRRHAYIAKDDPSFVDLPVPDEAEILTISFNIYPAAKELMAAACETEKENRKLIARLARVPDFVWKMQKLRKKIKGSRKSM